MHLADYKVRILTPEAGTAAVTRVIIESADADGRRWSTVGVSTNVIDASTPPCTTPSPTSCSSRAPRRVEWPDHSP